MKKIFLIAVISLLFYSGYSQTSFGVQVGGNFASATLKYPFLTSTLDQDNKGKIGIVAGVLAEIPFGNSINFRPEINFVQRGFKFDETFGSIKETQEWTLNYVEISPNFVYTLPAGPGNVYFGLGPNFGLGISGEEKTTETNQPDEKTKFKFDGENNLASTDNKYHLKAFDFGGNVLAGYKLNNGLFFTLGYNMNFFNLIEDEGYTYKNKSAISFKVGYLFGGSKASAN